VSYLATFLLTFGLVLVVVWVFVKVGTPVYRIERENIITLFEMVLAGGATENDWQVFIGVPLRHNSELADIQQRCIELTAKEYAGGRGDKLFSARGLAELEGLLKELKHNGSQQ
jgi:hypothetical protein